MWKFAVAGAVVAIILLLALPIRPIWSAHQQFKHGTYDIRCQAAQDLAKEWAGVGFAAKSEEWGEKARLTCLRAERLSSEGT